MPHWLPSCRSPACLPTSVNVPLPVFRYNKCRTPLNPIGAQMSIGSVGASPGQTVCVAQDQSTYRQTYRSGKPSPSKSAHAALVHQPVSSSPVAGTAAKRRPPLPSLTLW